MFLVYIYVYVYGLVRPIIIINNLWTMFLCIEFHFNEMSREIGGSRSNFQMWDTLKLNAAEIKATMSAIQ